MNTIIFCIDEKGKKYIPISGMLKYKMWVVDEIQVNPFSIVV